MKQETLAEMLGGKSHPTIWLRASDLEIIWPKAQRDLAPHRVKEIVADFNTDAFGTLTVLQAPDGRYHVADGWARTNAVRLLFDATQRVPCTVIPCRNGREAARIFNLINGGRIKPTALQMFVTGVEAGNGVEAAVSEIAARARLHIGPSGGEGEIRAVSTVMSVYRQFGGDRLRDTLWLIRDTWGTDPANFDAHLIRGFALFLGTEPDMQRGKLAAKIARRFTAARMLGSARATREAFGGSMAKAVAALLVDVNSKRASPRVTAPESQDASRAA